MKDAANNEVEIGARVCVFPRKDSLRKTQWFGYVRDIGKRPIGTPIDMARCDDGPKVQERPDDFGIGSWLKSEEFVVVPG